MVPQRLLSASALVLVIAVASGCTNMRAVRDFAASSASLTDYSGVTERYVTSADRQLADLPPELRDQPASQPSTDWTDSLSRDVDRLLASSPGEVFEQLSQVFERTLIRRALVATGGRKIEAAQLLGIGRNTITRKIQDLEIEDVRHSPIEAEHGD